MMILILLVGLYSVFVLLSFDVASSSRSAFVTRGVFFDCYLL